MIQNKSLVHLTFSALSLGGDDFGERCAVGSVCIDLMFRLFWEWVVAIRKDFFPIVPLLSV